MTLAVVDSGVANLTSVKAALKRLGVDAQITSAPEVIQKSSHVILPGVGAISAAMRQLSEKKLINVIRGLKQPTLGICLGMQILFERSEESGGCEGLGVIPGTVEQLPVKPDMPIPHMGWNQIRLEAKDHPLLQNIENESFVYFVHSFAAPVGSDTLASCAYSEVFTAIVGHGNFFGCQFHPERSSGVGRQVLKNFLDL